MRKLISLLLAFALCFACCSCHGQRGVSEFEIPDSFDESQQYEITFWAKNDTNKTQTQIYQQTISEFEKLYPNITVNIRLYTDYNKIYNDVITNISTGTTPNVCITYPDHIATYITGSNTVVPLDSLFDDAKYGLGGSEVKFDGPTKDEIIPQFLSECYIGETCYAIPYMRSTEACYVNKTYVEALGFELPEALTWDFVWEVSEAATAKNSDGTYAINGQNVMIPFIYKSSDNMLITMLKQQGAGYSDDDGNVLIFNDTTTADLKTIASHVKTGAFSTFTVSGYPANFLNAGQCIFAIDSTAGSTWMGSEAPLLDIAEDKIVDFETVVYPVPQFDTSNPQMISQGPSICIFNKNDSGEVLASWLFAQYLLTNDVQIAYASTEGYVPVTSKAQESDEYQEYLNLGGTDSDEHYQVKIDATKLLIDNVDKTFTTPVFNGSTSLRNAAGQLVNAVVKSVNRKQTIDDQYIEDLYSDTTSLYRLDSIQSQASSEADLGPLPSESKVLLLCLGIAWAGIIAFFIYDMTKKRGTAQ